jgi:hypothetical protein
MSGRHPPDSLHPREWFQRFRVRYDASASDPTSAVGLLYERHRDLARSEAAVAADAVEYTNRAWTNALGTLAARLALELGFDQVTEWTSEQELMWLRLGESQKAAVLIHQANDAHDSIVTSVLPRLVRSGAPLCVLVMYPDYPPPEGATTLERATEVWRMRIEAALRNLRARTGFLLLTIGWNQWGVPAPWRGFSWDAQRGSLAPIGIP